MTKARKRIVFLFIASILTLLSILCFLFDEKIAFPFLIFSYLVVSFSGFYLINKRTIFYNEKGEKMIIPTSFTSNENEAVIEEVVIDWAKDRENEIKQLKANEEFRKEFIGNVAHELKTPIFNIQGYILTLLDGGWKDKKISKKYLDRTEKNINRLLSLVADLDTITQVESGRLKMKKSHFNIKELIEEIFEMQEINIQTRNISLAFEYDDKSPEIFVYADEEKIFEVLLNLIENSVKYGNTDGKTIVSAFEEDNKINIKISDNGIGIAKEHLQRVFERFYRVDKSRSREMGGSGLGLAIVKHIIEAHKQKISVKSKPNEGTTFTFTLDKGNKELAVTE